MDFKELLSLAKDNQSFAMKRYQRDSSEKAKARNGGVSDSAVKSFLAKKKLMEEQRKAAEEAERRSRILARLDAGQGKRKTGKDKYIDKEAGKERKVSTEPSTQEAQHRMELSKAAANQQRKPHVQNTEKQDRFQIPKKKANEGTWESTSKVKDFISTDGNNSKPVPSKESGLGTFRQYRRRKGKDSDFEWSGSTSTIPNSSAMRDKSQTIRKPMGKMSASVPSFQELMSIAQRQKDKPIPVVAKNTLDAKKIDSKNPDSVENISNSGATVVSERGRKSGLKGQYLSDIEKGRKVSAHEDIKDQISRQSRCTVTTHTIDVKSNYDAMGNPISAQRGYSSKSRLVSINNGTKMNGEVSRSNARSKRLNISSIDDELELERIELERKRNLLRMKLKGGKGINDYYDNPNDCFDDMDDFIDDTGDEVDYSKHIRGIFGYDRRRYIDEDDDLKDMESNYRQIAAEEARSMRIAKLEDEIERRKEEIEKNKAKRFKN